jgi:hypothetical protein
MNNILTCEKCGNQINTQIDTFGHDDEDRLVCDSCISEWTDYDTDCKYFQCTPDIFGDYTCPDCSLTGNPCNAKHEDCMVYSEYKETLCSCGDMVGIQCPNPAKWINQNGVKVCDHGKLLLDAFTWENRNERKWSEIC